MRTNTFHFLDEENVRIHVYHWLPDEAIEIQGVVQIAHGMTETALRYERFAEKLTAAGYVVYANDHRGHGRTAATEQDLGYVGENGFMWMVRNMAQLTKIIREQHNNLPLFLFAHSMGSFLAQQYITEHADLIDGLILCGSNGPRGPELLAGASVTKLIASMKGSRHRSAFIDKLAFGSFNRKFQPARTQVDWLSRDPKEVDKYVEDPYCGFLSTVGFYRDFFKLLRNIHRPEVMNHIPKQLPILLIAGDDDPVGNYGKGVRKLADQYRQLGLEQVECKLYEGARHELLNETNRDEVTADCLAWLQRQTLSSADS
ncbi:alpha/beta hydrolase [Paenibacillus alvei]|uniref:Alpha/beta hydrolase n=1 Tax=Paenibacillus alvei TaxID=44250 RepID=A0AAP7A2B6_PAEAL|nr:alpha/beta hydrolase [Paenibacillus alvei]NOJ71563.1 alpha/beta hydrolase [Paenibacillus alvei]